MEAVRPYIDAVLPHVEAAKEATLAGVEATRPYMEAAAGATGDAAGYMYGAAKEATIAGMEAAAAQAEAVRPHVEELAGSISLNPLTPIFEQDFALPVLASLLWFFVFDSFTGVQVITMGATSADRFSYHGNPRWEVADRTVLNLLEQTPLFLTMLWTHAIFVDAYVAGVLGLCAVGARLAYPVLRSVATPFMEFSTQGYWFAVNPLWANVFWKIGFGKPLLTAAALGTADGLKLQFATYIGMLLVKVPIILPIFLALKWAPYKIVATKPKAKAD